MPTKTSIEWTDYSSNPIRFRAENGATVPWACVKVSPGCANCYAEGQSWRFLHRDYTVENMRDLAPFLDERELHALLTSKAISGKRVFIGDMTDIFGEWVPIRFILSLWMVFASRPDVTWQVLTKRSKRMRDIVSPALMHRAIVTEDDDEALAYWPSDELSFSEALYRIEYGPLSNVWLGVSAEDQQRADERIPDSLATPAAVRFVSAEPLIGSIDFESAWHGETALDAECWGSCSWCKQHPPLHNCQKGLGDINRVRSGVDWVIVGGESGPGARPCDVAWIRSIVQQCQSAAVPVFVKQLGANAVAEINSPDQNGPMQFMKDRKGGDPSEWPDDLRVRQYPREAR